MRSTHLKTIGVFQEAAARVMEAGYPRTATQCRAKFKRDKGWFFNMLGDWDGLPPIPACPPRFGFLLALWELGRQP